MGLFSRKKAAPSVQSIDTLPPPLSASASLDSGYRSAPPSTKNGTFSSAISSSSSTPSSSYQRLISSTKQKHNTNDIILSGPLPKVSILPVPQQIDQVPKPPKELFEPLMKGIWYHEQDCMEASTYYLSVAANEGSQLGLFLYAIHLRHGWGVVRDEAAAVRILVRTAEAAVGEVMDDSDSDHGSHVSAASHARSDHSRSASMGMPTQQPSTSNLKHHRQSKLGHKTTRIRRIAAEELSFALFELSQCFRQGWGVKRDRDTGLYYLRVAAQLGDMDAQLEMGEVYLRGSDGVRADKKKAAQMFRLALAQGAEVPGMHWVYKEKYNNDVVY